MTTLYMLIAREGDKVHYRLGGGSSSPAIARVYDTREKAERHSTKMYAMRGRYSTPQPPIEIIEVHIPATKGAAS